MTNWLIALLLAAAQQVSPAQPPASAQDTPVDPEVRARFRVVVTADLTMSRQVYDFLSLVLARNASWQRLGKAGRTPEAELVRLFTNRAIYPAYRNDPGIILLRFDMAKDRVTVEYCLSRCTETNAKLAVYGAATSTFLDRLQKETSALERYRKERRLQP